MIYENAELYIVQTQQTAFQKADSDTVKDDNLSPSSSELTTDEVLIRTAIFTAILVGILILGGFAIFIFGCLFLRLCGVNFGESNNSRGGAFIIGNDDNDDGILDVFQDGGGGCGGCGG